MSITVSTTVLQAEGMTATGLPLPDDIVDRLGSAKNAAVVVTVNGYSYRSTLSSRDGGYILPLSAAHRGAAGVKAGDEVVVTLEVDTQPRELAIPEDLGAALTDAGLADTFAALSFSKKRAHVDPIVAAKAAETRQRRIEKVIAALQP